jgi:hypothetical protein
MSLPTFPYPPEELKRDDAINLILSSIAMEEVGLSHIINAEGEKLQYMLGTLSGMTAPAGNVDQVLEANKSVQKMLQSASYNQMFLSAKMENALAASEVKQSPPIVNPTPNEPPNQELTPPPPNSSILSAVSDFRGSSIASHADDTQNDNLIIGNTSAVHAIGRIGDQWIAPDEYEYFLPLQIVADGVIPEWTAQMVAYRTIGLPENSPVFLAQLWYAPPVATSPLNIAALEWTLAGEIDLGTVSYRGENEIYKGKQTLDPPYTVEGDGFLLIRFGVNAAVETSIDANLSSANVVIV